MGAFFIYRDINSPVSCVIASAPVSEAISVLCSSFRLSFFPSFPPGRESFRISSRLPTAWLRTEESPPELTSVEAGTKVSLPAGRGRVEYLFFCSSFRREAVRNLFYSPLKKGLGPACRR